MDCLNLFEGEPQEGDHRIRVADRLNLVVEVMRWINPKEKDLANGHQRRLEWTVVGYHDSYRSALKRISECHGWSDESCPRDLKALAAVMRDLGRRIDKVGRDLDATRVQ